MPCEDLLREIEANPDSVPDWFLKNTVEMFKNGGTSCETFQESANYLSNVNLITGELQQSIQLIQSGIETTRRSDEIDQSIIDSKERDEQLRKEIQANTDFIQNVQGKLTDDVVGLGEAAVDASEATGQAQAFGLLGTALGGSSLIILGIFLFLLVRSR